MNVDMNFMRDFTKQTDAEAFELKVGDLLKVKTRVSTKEFGRWLQAGDVVKVIAVYPHIVMVEAVKGLRIRQSYGRKWWKMELERVM